MTWLKRIGLSLLGLVLLAYIVYNAFVVPYTSVKTEAALSFSAKESIAVTDSLVIRSERPVAAETQGVCSYAVENGSKVANGGTIATLYASETAAQSQQKLAVLDRKIANLEALQGMSSNIVVSAEQLEKQLHAQLLTTLQAAGDGNFAGIEESSQTYLTLLNRRMAVTDSTSDFSALLAALKSERETLVASAGAPVATVSAPCSGYFISAVDGYEAVLTPEGIADLTPEIFDGIRPDADLTAASYVGKVVSDMEWYLAARVSFDDALLFVEGSELTLEMTSASTGELPVTVARVNKSAAGEDAVVIFRCSYMSAELSALRTPSFQIILKRYDGLRVPTVAVRVGENKDGSKVKGVFVVIGSTMRFVPVEILYNGNGYVVCRRIDPMQEGLHLYDDVIVKGKDLRDGKPIQ